MKNNNKKKTIVLIIIYTLILFASMVGATFAYFTSTATGNTSKVSLKASTLGEAYASGTTVILKVTDEDMQQVNSSNEYTAYKESNEFNELTLTSSVGDTFKNVTCTYDIEYVPSTPYYASKTNTSNLMEFTVNGYQVITAGNPNVEVTGSMVETNLTNITDNIILVHNAVMKINGTNNSGETTWYFKPRFYNLNIDQQENANITFGGTIQIASLACINSDS